MNIQLSISLLVSDRMETLRKCLDSLKPILKEMDSELIAVFTGKQEETLKLLQQYTSHIIPFTWCDDFSKARNAGLKEARGEWFLYLDDDEWFEDTGEIIRFFKSGEYKHYQSAFYIVRNYLDLEGKHFSDADVGRMCMLTPETEFVLPIHEYLTPFEKPNKKLISFVHHFGYVRKEKNMTEGAKAGRNLPVLLKMLEEEPDSAHCCMQISQEYWSVEDYVAALEYCRKGLMLSRREERIHTHELWLQANLPLLVSLTDGPRVAFEEGERILKHPRTLEVGALHLCITLTALCKRLKEYRKGLKYVCLFHEKLLYLRKHPERAMLQNAGEVNLENASAKEVSIYMEGLFFAAEADDFRSVRQFLSWFPWEEKERVLPMYPRLEEWKKNYKEKNETILKEYDRLDTGNIYVCIQKTLWAEKQGKMQEAGKLWTVCADDCPPGFQWELIEIAVRCRFAMEPLLEQMTPEDWTGYAEAVAANKETEILQDFYEKIRPLLESYPFYARKLEQCILEKMLAEGISDFSRLSGLLRRYCASVRADAEALYRDEALAEPIVYALPSSYRFALNLEQALLLMEQKQFTDSIPLLKEALQICPQMSAAVSQLIRYLDEEIRSPRQEISEEFITLGRQVKQVLYTLIENRQWKEAHEVAARLLSLLPDDLEVLRLKQEILQKESGKCPP